MNRVEQMVFLKSRFYYHAVKIISFVAAVALYPLALQKAPLVTQVTVLQYLLSLGVIYLLSNFVFSRIFFEITKNLIYKNNRY